MTNGSEVMINIIWGCCYNFWFEPNDVTSQLWYLGLIEARSEETLNIEVVGNSISFLKREKTQNFDIKQWNHEALKLIKFLRYGFELESIFLKFLLIFKIRFLMQYDSMMPCNISVLYVPHQKKKLAKYRWRTCSQWQNALIPVVNYNETTLCNHG
jgi:hypothetical protein